MAKIPTIDDVAISVDNYPSKNPYAENVADKESPPSYSSVNPLSNNTGNVGLNTIQSQPQPQCGPTSYVVTTAPICYVPVTANPALNNIHNYKVWSVLNIFFCCICLGFAACYYSTKTDSLISRGDVQGALNASRTARTFNIITTVTGVIIITINIIYQTNKY